MKLTLLSGEKKIVVNYIGFVAIYETKVSVISTSVIHFLRDNPFCKWNLLPATGKNGVSYPYGVFL